MRFEIGYDQLTACVFLDKSRDLFENNRQCILLIHFALTTTIDIPMTQAYSQ